jgi:hypothetical protein
MQIPEGRGVPQGEPREQPEENGAVAGAAASIGAPDGVSPVLAPPVPAADAAGRNPFTADARATADAVKRESANIEGAVLFAEMVRAGLKVHARAIF